MDLKLKTGLLKLGVRRHPAGQRAYLKGYVKKNVQSGSLLSKPSKTWRAPPRLVSKQSEITTFWITINLLPVSAATKSKTCPMENLEPKLANYTGSTFFATHGFSALTGSFMYTWGTQSTCRIISRHGVDLPARVLHGLRKAVAHFQTQVPWYSQRMQAAFKSWIDNFVVHGRTEEAVIGHLGKNFQPCKCFSFILSARKCWSFSKNSGVVRQNYRLHRLQAMPMRLRGF